MNGLDHYRALFGAAGPAGDSERIRSALNCIPAHDRDTWLRMGMAVKSELGDDGFEVWNEWSEQAESYNARDARDVWRSIHGNGKVTAGTLFHEAKANGWRDDGTSRSLTPEEVARRRRDADARAAKEAADVARERTTAASKALAIWKAAAPATDEHPYLRRKGVPAEPTLRVIDASAAEAFLGYVPKSRGDLLVGRLLVVPIKVGDALSTLELIDESGRKSALAGGAKSGGYWAARPLPEGDGEGVTLLLGEGVATVLSAMQASGHAVIATLTAANLSAVAVAMRKRYPRASLIVLGELGNGQDKAEQAARAAGALLALPDFGQDRPDDAKDFNDLAQLAGREAVLASLAHATALDASPRGPAAYAAPATDSGGPAFVIRRLCDIEAKPIRWLWPGRIARGKVSMIAGHPGLGKSQLTAALAAVVTTGGTWPVDRTACERGRVILLNAEDDAADTIRPRLEAAGADLTRCDILDFVVDGYEASGDPSLRGFNLKADLKALGHLLAAQPDVAMIVIDPITAYLSGVETHVNADVRAVLAPLGEMAAKHSVAVVCVSHLNKAGGGRGSPGEAMMRVSGSLAFVAAARAAYLVVRDPDAQNRRLFLPAKNNVGKDESGLAFTVESFALPNGIETSRVMWEPNPVSVSADEAMAPPPEEGERNMTDDAIGLLEAVLAYGRVNSRDIKRQAQDAGISDRALRVARERLKLTVEREGVGSDMKSFWRLPPAPFVPSEGIHAIQNGVARIGGDGTNGTNEAAGEVL